MYTYTCRIFSTYEEFIKYASWSPSLFAEKVGAHGHREVGKQGRKKKQGIDWVYNSRQQTEHMFICPQAQHPQYDENSD